MTLMMLIEQVIVLLPIIMTDVILAYGTKSHTEILGNIKIVEIVEGTVETVTDTMVVETHHVIVIIIVVVDLEEEEVITMIVEEETHGGLEIEGTIGIEMIEDPDLTVVIEIVILETEG